MLLRSVRSARWALGRGGARAGGGRRWVAEGAGAGADRPALRPALEETEARVIRFEDGSGSEYFGVFADEEQTKAFQVHRDEESGRLHVAGDALPVESVLPPVDPPAVWCVGLNYRAHAAEAKMEVPAVPVFFLKAWSSLVGHNGVVVIPACAREPREVDYEGELAVVIGAECRNASEHNALDFVLGYTIANDISARRWQGKKGGGQWSRAKSFDTFCPLGPYIVPRRLVPDPQKLRIRTLLNGEVMQDASTDDMVFSVAEIVAALSQGTTLHPGTVILTGTPAGVGYTRAPPVYLKKGDVVEVEIDLLGKLTSHVAEEEDWGGISLN
jgi:2-keto-4-pentenoate hydratase/2-oxohepta-3-ene-1,7-dioic acid hydratase in catechol pathway